MLERGILAMCLPLEREELGRRYQKNSQFSLPSSVPERASSEPFGLSGKLRFRVAGTVHTGGLESELAHRVPHLGAV